MYVSYLQLDKDPAMYPGGHQSPAVTRHPGLSLSPQSFPAPPQYSDFTGYHHAHHAHHAHHHGGINPEPQQSSGGPGGPGGGGGWSSYPPPPRDDWASHHHYAAAAAAAAAGVGAPPGASSSGVVGPTLGFSPPDFTGQPGALLQTSLNPSAGAGAGQLSPGSPQRRNAYDWIRRSSAPSLNPNGKTRTKDKYRVVYTDHQRLELEKEFHYSKYITIRRKAELATTLGLSERQVKIWFQNRRAKERKINKKKLQQPASSTTTPPISGGGGGNSVAMVTSSSGNNNNNNNNNNGLVSPSSLPLNIKEEY
ncbi:homeobox protein CDX-1-like [Sander lucioperca]|uniref:homeobox protein CDX-1-like n=1 Tax=Sander lucioperca TaxID=283035 RepID=UPI00125D46E8|nr:homeobox protein CDX-1-like [Sander lucioperca]